MLVILDLDDTLIAGHINPRRPYDEITPLPKVKERLEAAKAEGHTLCIATNQRGAAFGYHTIKQAQAKLDQVMAMFDIAYAAVCYSDVRSRNPKYNDPTDAARAKPSGAMLRECIKMFPEAAKQGVIYVGDRPEDEAAAKDAGGLAFIPANEFFT